MPHEITGKIENRGEIEHLAKQLAEGDMQACDVYCRLLGCHNPELAWKPPQNGMPFDGMNWLYDWWLDVKGDSLAPSASEISPEKLLKVLGNLVLLEPNKDETDFFIRLYGSRIQSQPGKDMTGQMVSETWTPLRGFFLINYQAVCLRKEPLLTYHTPPENVNIMAWNRLILPFIDDGKISKILVAIYPNERQKTIKLF